jgi:3',5'-cyclic AMP phosphodiesterase CpdA
MLRLAHITDTHITAPEERLCGLHTPTLLRSALADVARAPEGTFDAIVITGDLTHRGEPEAYAEFVRCLEDLSLTVLLGIGNHDDRENFRTVFAFEPRYAEGEFVQYAVNVGGHRLVMLDTNVPGEVTGLLCDTRLAWLDETLSAEPDIPTLVFLHHPPFVTHIRAMDARGLQNIEEFAAVIERHPQVRSLHSGHVHRVMQGRLGDTPAVTASSTCHQVALEFEAPGLMISYEPPSYAMILAEDGQVLTHTVYFTDQAVPHFPYGQISAR